MNTSGVSSRGEFKTNGGVEFVEVTATVGVFVEETATVEVFGDGISRSHAVRNDTARMHEDVFKKSRREKSFFI
ncbi:MAG: hypothetical protein WBV22_11600 [Anaerolineaceae bacterium]